jgi:hypothetical protein
MAQTRHRSVAVARRYIRDGSLFPGERGGSGVMDITDNTCGPPYTRPRGWCWRA